LCFSVIVVALGGGCGDDDGGNGNENDNQNGNTSQAVCGNGELEAGEQCDDGSENSDTAPDACRSDCRSAYCGDGVQDSAEQCDEGTANSDAAPNACRTNCQAPSCGDGVVDPSPDPTLHEECDDGPENSDTAPGACRSDCHAAACGDGILDPGQHCFEFGAVISSAYPGLPVDLDGNPLVDFVVGADRVLTVLTQDATGSFTAQPGGYWGGGDFALAGDFDDDGDGDLLVDHTLIENLGGPGATPVLRAPYLTNLTSYDTPQAHRPSAVLLLQNEQDASLRLVLVAGQEYTHLRRVDSAGFVASVIGAGGPNLHSAPVIARRLPDVTGEGYPEALLCYQFDEWGFAASCHVLHVEGTLADPTLSYHDIGGSILRAVPFRSGFGEDAGILAIYYDPNATPGPTELRFLEWDDANDAWLHEFDRVAELSLPEHGVWNVYAPPGNAEHPDVALHKLDGTTHQVEVYQFDSPSLAYGTPKVMELPADHNLVDHMGMGYFDGSGAVPDIAFVAYDTSIDYGETLVVGRWDDTNGGYTRVTGPFQPWDQQMSLVGDFDGDGQDDVLVSPDRHGNGYGTNTRLDLYPSGAVDASPVRVDLARGVGYVTGGDWDGDGAEDVGALTGDRMGAAVLLQRAGGLRTHRLLRGPGGESDILARATSSAVADVTGDGVVDAVVLAEERLLVLSDLQDGAFSTVVETSLPVPLVYVEAVDVDGDGDLDLMGHRGVFTSNRAPTPEVFVLYNDDGQPGHFGTIETYATEYDVHALASGDLDEDGRPDLVVAHGQVGVLGVHLNTGGTPRFAEHSLHLTGGTVAQTDLVDLDADGHLDLLATTPFEGNGPVLFWGAGDGSLGPALDLPYLGGEFFMDVRDMDGDADLDISLIRLVAGFDQISTLLLTNAP
jgi:hypothetical protein